jgi:HSP20 family molecular chaperone IbpA
MKPSPRHREGDRYPRFEREAGPFKKTLVFPSDADVRRFQAILSNGILAIRVPRTGSRGKERIHDGA